jgi:hypothetical protein
MRYPSLLMRYTRPGRETSAAYLRYGPRDTIPPPWPHMLKRIINPIVPKYSTYPTPAVKRIVSGPFVRGFIYPPGGEGYCALSAIPAFGL